MVVIGYQCLHNCRAIGLSEDGDGDGFDEAGIVVDASVELADKWALVVLGGAIGRHATELLISAEKGAVGIGVFECEVGGGRASACEGDALTLRLAIGERCGDGCVM